MTQIYMVLALLTIMVINILQGTTLATIKNTFNKKAMLNGIYKSFVIIVSFVGLYIAIYFIPDFKIFGFTGYAIINGITAVAIVKYATDIAKKLIELVGLNVKDFTKDAE